MQFSTFREPFFRKKKSRGLVDRISRDIAQALILPGPERSFPIILSESNYGWALAFRAFLATRWRARFIRNRVTLGRYQRLKIEKLCSHAANRTEYYRPFRDVPFIHWPIIDKVEAMAHFPEMNVSGIGVETIRTAIAENVYQLDGSFIGQSTGTSGNRGYYLISDAERFVWLGTILAKTLPNALWRHHRVALALPGPSALYSSASTGSRIKLRFFDLKEGIGSAGDALVEFAPDTIVAPPKVLRWLAERRLLRAERVFSTSEVLDPLDRSIIEGATGRIVREIYMATEGLFGVSCSLGVLHLAEDVVHFEWERPTRASALRSPIVTDFTRRSQALIRYRLNDLLDLHSQRCLCGSPYTAVRRIEGRSDDIFLLPGPDGSIRMLTPDVLRNAVVDSHPDIQDFRVDQIGPTHIRVSLDSGLATDIDALVQARLGSRFAALGFTPKIEIIRGIESCFGKKLRRIRRLDL